MARDSPGNWIISTTTLKSVTSAAILVPECIPSESVETSQAQMFENTVSIGSLIAISEARLPTFSRKQLGNIDQGAK